MPHANTRQKAESLKPKANTKLRAANKYKAESMLQVSGKNLQFGMVSWFESSFPDFMRFYSIMIEND
jgi:hypothetical protein